jgi:predicted O-methyltransferase YrrM
MYGEAHTGIMRSERDGERQSSPALSPLGEPLSPPVPSLLRRSRQPLGPGGMAKSARGPAPLLRPAARKQIKQRMLLLRSAGLTRLQAICGVDHGELKQMRRELQESGLPDQLVARGAGLAFTQEFPQGALLYLLVRALRPDRVVETGVRPGYSSAWILAALAANGSGELTSLGPGPTAGRPTGVHDVGVGQFVPPALRSRWTLVLGNTTESLEQVLRQGPVDLFFYDNGPDADRAWFELRAAWQALTPDGVLLAHHIEANGVWGEFCKMQGLPRQLLDPGPPPLGALTVRGVGRA